MSTDYTAKDGTVWREPAAEDLAEGTPFRAHVEETIDDWATNYITDGGRVSSYTEWVERIEGTEWPGSPGVRISLGSSTDKGSPIALIKTIARSIAKDYR